MENGKNLEAYEAMEADIKKLKGMLAELVTDECGDEESWNACGALLRMTNSAMKVMRTQAETLDELNRKIDILLHK